MTAAYRSNRKATDDDIIRLNSVGLSLNTVAEQLGCHPTTITLRLKDLGINPSDTRRAFMESIYMGMSKPEQEWLEGQARAHSHIKDFIKTLLIKEYLASKSSEPV
jgi:hypothetical protein